MDTAQAKSALRHPSRTDPHIASSVGRFDKVGRSVRIFRKRVLIFFTSVVDILGSILTQAQFFESLWNAHGISKPMPLDSQRTLSRTSAVVSVEFSNILKQNSSIVLAMTPRLHMTRPPMKSMICKCPDTHTNSGISAEFIEEFHKGPGLTSFVNILVSSPLWPTKIRWSFKGGNESISMGSSHSHLGN